MEGTKPEEWSEDEADFLKDAFAGGENSNHSSHLPPPGEISDTEPPQQGQRSGVAPIQHSRMTEGNKLAKASKDSAASARASSVENSAAAPETSSSGNTHKEMAPPSGRETTAGPPKADKPVAVKEPPSAKATSTAVAAQPKIKEANGTSNCTTSAAIPEKASTAENVKKEGGSSSTVVKQEQTTKGREEVASESASAAPERAKSTKDAQKESSGGVAVSVKQEDKVKVEKEATEPALGKESAAAAASSESQIENSKRVKQEDAPVSRMAQPPSNDKEQDQKPQHGSPQDSLPYYGVSKLCKVTGDFPAIGSQLGEFVCMGGLGKGTFSSIHKCVNLSHFHNEGKDDTMNDNSSKKSSRRRRRPRLVAAKVELSDFAQSGVLDSEANIMDFLDRTLPPGTVPMFMGHWKTGVRVGSSAASSSNGEEYQPPRCSAAIVMEYLQGEDMHQLREKVIDAAPKPKSQQPQQPPSRRVSLEDAVHWTADILLPLLEQMHNVGIVHRDVKPSNVVRRFVPSATTKKGEEGEFCLVDFGLSKSVVVPTDARDADASHPWNGQHYLKPYQNYVDDIKNSTNSSACFRSERSKADFRGTSMYASLRVHQLKEYAFRDDVWSLLYVFCDLVSGGLPWMSDAANRDRDKCFTLKQLIHGSDIVNNTSTGATDDQTERLLMGDDYNVALSRKERHEAAAAAAGGPGIVTPPVKKLPPLPEPLAMSKDKAKVDLLRKAFRHVSQLQYWDRPNYGFIQECIRGFLQVNTTNAELQDPPIPRISEVEEGKAKSRTQHRKLKRKTNATARQFNWDLVEDPDPLTADVFDEAVRELEAEPDAGGGGTGAGDHEAMNQTGTQAANDDDNRRKLLPLELQFRLAQMEHNAENHTKVPVECALRDWMKVTAPLLYGEGGDDDTIWDTRKYEGAHRTSTDGFKRDFYLSLLILCRQWANAFDNFRSAACFFDGDDKEGATKVKKGDKSSESREKKKRKIVSDSTLDPSSSDMVNVSRSIYGLNLAIKKEQAKMPPPPGRILFG